MRGRPCPDRLYAFFPRLNRREKNADIAHFGLPRPRFTSQWPPFPLARTPDLFVGSGVLFSFELASPFTDPLAVECRLLMFAAVASLGIRSGRPRSREDGWSRLAFRMIRELSISTYP